MTAGKKIVLPTERLDYLPIAGRRPLELPGGARMAAWIIVNVEEWDPREAMPRTVSNQPTDGAVGFGEVMQ
jgi:allantoinase